MRVPIAFAEGRQDCDRVTDSAYIEVNGVRICYDLGGAGQPVVLVHGSWGDRHNWEPIAPMLKRSFTVLVYDRRGHSQSERPPGPGHITQDVEDLAQLIQQLKLSPAHIVGNSFGGTIALRLATQRQDLVRSLAVHEPPLIGLLSDSGEESEQIRAFHLAGDPILAKLGAGRNEEAAHQFVDEIALGPGSWDALPEAVRQMFVHNAPTYLDEIRDASSMAIDRSQLRAIRCPTLVTFGGRSPSFFSAIARAVAEGIPGAQLRRIARAGHVPQTTNPPDYVKTLARFLRSPKTGDS